ncbi:MAG: ATP-binding protein, partial [Candidatus Riesia sp.]|nr:ATP-binding protein [Candidatus Riesia sp.]
MGKRVLIIAESGSGKSHSVQHLKPEETFIMNVASKDLPFKGWKNKYPLWTPQDKEGRMMNNVTAQDVLEGLTYIDKHRPDIKNVVIDDYQYISAFEFFHRSNETGYGKFTDIGNNIMMTAEKPMHLRDDLMVFYLTHAEDITDSSGRVKQKAKTIGKLVDSQLTLEGLFPIVLYGKKRDN